MADTQNGVSTALQTIDTTTGEVTLTSPEEGIEKGALSALLETINDGTRRPIHLQALEHMEVDDAMRDDLENAYNGEDVHDFKEVAGQELKVFGAIIYEHGPFKQKDGVWNPRGYFQVRLLVEDRKGEIITVKSSGIGLAEHVFYILRRRGWYLFEKPITYRFSLGKNNEHYMYNVEHDLRGRLQRQKAGTK